MPKNKLLPRDRVATETLLAIVTTSTYTEAAKKLGITYKAICKRREKFKLDEQIDAFPMEALSRLKIGSVRAANELVSELDSKRLDNRNRAANEILGYVIPKLNLNLSANMSFDLVGEDGNPVE